MTVTTSQMKQLERQADQNGLRYLDMMERAGRAVADHVIQIQQPLRTAVVYVGKGNNGGDGLVAARLLRDHGVRTVVILVEGQPQSAEARVNFERLDGDMPVWDIETLQMDQINWIFDADVTIDALYGTGFHGAFTENARAAATMICRSLGTVFAIDLPSGVSADTGEAVAGAAMADHTIALHACKPAHELARAHCGLVTVADIGISDALTAQAAPAGPC